jgi:hypothetical protein
MDIDMTAKVAELKKHLEGIAGSKIDLSAEQLVAAVFPVSASTYLASHNDPDNDAWVTKRRLIFPQPTCADSELLDTSALSETGTDGKLVFRLRTYLCDRLSLNSFEEPVNLVATPQGPKPHYVTLLHHLIKDNPASSQFTDVEITAFTWNPDGSAAPNVWFFWRCRVVAYDFVQ